jgi:ubiquinone biosynthesis protein
VQVPALLDHCTPRVTAMARVTGHKVTEHRLQSDGAKQWLAGLVVKTLLARPFFSTTARALFHGDPHAGNLFLTADHRLAVLDWSLAGSLGEAERDALVQIILGALMLHPERIVAALEALGQRQVIDRDRLEAVVQGRIDRVLRGQFPGFTWLMGLLDEAVQTARLRVGGDLLLFRKTLHTLEGVLADLGVGNGQIDEVLLGEFLAHLVCEWPRRWLSLPHSRAYATRLSTAELLGLVVSVPWTAARFWSNQFRLPQLHAEVL